MISAKTKLIELPYGNLNQDESMLDEADLDYIISNLKVTECFLERYKNRFSPWLWRRVSLIPDLTEGFIKNNQGMLKWKELGTNYSNLDYLAEKYPGKLIG